jgi:CrcB protein
MSPFVPSSTARLQGGIASARGENPVMQTIVIVFLGGGIGAVLRHWLTVVCSRACGTAFPFGTAAVNVFGSFCMGMLVGWLALRAAEIGAASTRLFLMTGVLGGFTTFSAFSLDAVLLWERGQPGLAAAYVAGSVVLSILGLCAGLAVARTLS